MAKTSNSPSKMYTIEDIRKYRRKNLSQTYRSGRWSILFDICIKVLIAVELIYSMILSGGQTLFMYITGFILAGNLLLILVDLRLLAKLESFRETDSVISNLKERLNYFLTSHRIFILISSLSSPLFVLAGFFLYYHFKYGNILLESPVSDPVPYLFLVIAFAISYFSQKPVYKRQVKELKESIEDMDDTVMASIKIEESRKNRKRAIIIFSILILLGIFILLFFFFR